MAQVVAHVDTIAGHRAGRAVRAAASSAEAEAIGATAVALVLYLATCARDVQWGDAAKLTLYVWRFFPSLDQDVHLGAIAWAWPFAQLPVGRFAFRVAIASVAASALTVGFVHALLLAHCRNRWAARAGTASLIVSHTFWFVSTIPESYAVSMLCVSAAAWLLINRRRPLGAGLLLGAGAVANPITLFGVPAAIWRLTRSAATRAAAGRFAAGVIVGVAAIVIAAAPFLETPVRSTLSEWARVVRSYTNSRLPLINIRLLAAYAAYNFAGGALWLIVRGAMRTSRIDRLALTLYAGAHYAFAASYLPQRSYLIVIPVYFAAAWLVANGADDLIDRGPGWRPWAIVASVALPPPLLFAAAALLLSGRLPPIVRDAPFRDESVYFLQPWKSRDTSVRQYIDALDGVIPNDAVVFGDFTILMPLLYVNRVEGWKAHGTWQLIDGQSAASLAGAVDGYLDAGRRVFLLDARYFPADPGAHWTVVPASVDRLVELRKR